MLHIYINTIPQGYDKLSRVPQADRHDWMDQCGHARDLASRGFSHAGLHARMPMSLGSDKMVPSGYNISR